MERIEVDSGSLGAVGAELAESVAVAREVQNHHKRMAAHAAHSGHPDAADGIYGFLAAWAYGCGCLSGDAEAIGAAMRQADDVYSDGERQISTAAGADV